MLNHGIQLLCLLALLGCSTNGAEIEKGSGDLLKLYRYDKPQVPIGDNAVVSPGATVEILCNVDTIPEEIILINWEIDGNQLSFDSFNTVGYPNIRRYTERTLTIYNISSADAAVYTCVLVDSQTGEELDRADSMLQVTPDCPEGCQGVNGGKGFVGLRGFEGKQGRAGYPGVCYPEECPNPQMGEKGEPGSQGNNGEEGEMGIEGEKGAAGDNGMKGSAGDNGEKGDIGEKGMKGELGDQGENGERGIKGAEGDEGIRGGEGDKGMKGEKGEQGITTSGPSGEVGDQGPQGVSGEQGTTGTTGIVGEKGGPGERGVKGTKGSKGVTGTGGEKGMVGKNLLILSINSTYNKNCSNYEKGQIIYDTTIGKFIFCDGNQFQCIPDKPCREDCKDGDPTINTINPNIPAQCVNFIYVIDESASMRPEQQWLRDVANAIPRELRRINYNPGVCMNNFGVLGFGTGEEASRAEQIGRPIDLGGIITPEDQIFVPLWGSTSEVIRVINEGVFAGEGRREDGFAALYRALQRYTFVGVGCRKMLLITDEDRDNETPSPDPPYDRVPTLFNLNMQQILNQFSITLSAVISIQFQAQNDLQPNINYDTILGLLPNNSVIYYDENSQRNYSVASDGYVRRDSAAGNTEQTYFQQVRASGGIAWSLQASRTYRDAFTSAFLQFEIIPHVPQNNSTQSSGGCMLDSCNVCPCVDGERYCQPINNLDFNTTIKCRPTECNQTQIISGFRQPACIDMVFAFSETKTMATEHDSIRDVATSLAINLAKINFGQENSICPNTYCLAGFGSENDRNPDQCYTNSFRIPPNNQLCASSDQLANLILGLSLTATGNGSDGYAAIYTAIQTHQANFQSQSCRHITLVTDTNRLDCGSYTDGSISIPQLSQNNIESVLRDTNVVLNVIVNATFQDGLGTEALGIYQETNGSIVAVIPDSTAPFGFSTSPGGSVRLAGDQVEEDYIDLAIILGGSAWDIRKMGEQTDLFTKAFVQAVVIKSSESCGQTRACVECKCVGGELQRCEESTVCNITGEVPMLAYTSGNVTVSMDNLFIQVGGYGSTEEVVYYGIDGDKVNTFTLNTRLRRGTVPVNVTWYYVTEGGQMVLIEDSNVTQYVSVPQNNPYNLVFSQVGDAIQGSYLVVAENAYGRDTQLTNIGILPKWDKTLSGMVTGSEASLGQTLVGRFGSELRITGTVREGTEPWSFKLYYNGLELVRGQNYSVEYQDNQPIFVISNFRSSQIGQYMAIVSNRYGQDTDTFNLMAETVISCANNADDPSTTCRNCQFDEVTKNSTLTIYAHSFPRNLQLTWYRVDNVTGLREQIAENTAVEGANNIAVSVRSLCNYIYEVVIDQDTYNFVCPCALPLLDYTSGNVSITEDNQMVQVGGYGSSEREVNYGLDGDLVNTFTIYSRLTRGTEPVTVTWYYITPQGMRVLIEDSAVADYASVSETNPYNLVFSQVGDAIQGSYLVVAENAYGRDTQLTNIGILPKWDKTLSGMVTGSEASLGQTLVGRFGSELRITGTVREGTEPWSFRWYYNGVEIVEGGDYSFEYSGNQATIVIGNFEASDIGAYTAIVSNRYGQDTHTFNLMAETVVSCTDNITDTSTTCTECLFDEETKQSTLTVYAHSISQGQNLTWYQVNSETGEREQLSESVVVEGANSIIVSVSSLCNYSYEVVVEGQNTYQFQCVCALPLLDYTSGNVSITEDNQMVQVGGYGSSEREVNYGLDGDLVNNFTIYSRLTRGTEPVTVTWYYITPQGMRVLIEDSAVADYASVSENNSYNLVFSQVGDAIQGSYLVVAENAYGRDTQLTNIGILPKWDRTLSGMVTGTEASLGQTLVGRFGSELRITGTVREGTEPWSFGWYYNGVEIVEGGDYSFENSGNQATIVIGNFEASDIGAYTAIVSNRHGQDTHTFNLMGETVVSCTDNITDTSTTCTECLFDEETKQSTLTVYAHSISQGQNLTWYQVNSETGEREQLSESVVVEGANSIMVSVSSLCNYSYEVVVEGQNTYQFQCVCALPLLDYTSGNVSITEDNQMVQVGGYGSSEREVNYGLDGDLVNNFTIYSRLTRGTEPVTVTWYYITPQGTRVLIEDSAVADYASVSENNPYNLVFSQVGDGIQGSYLVVAENAYGRDTQLTNIGILPKWDKTLSGMVTGSEASLGQTLVGRFGSELRITGTVREGTEPWSFKLYYNGLELVRGQNYSVEYQDNQPIFVISNFRSSQIGQYMAIVSNRYGQDTDTFNLMAETVISCANNADDPSTTCRNCQFDEVTKNSTLTIYAHSFPRNQKLTWYRVDNVTGLREQIAENTAVEGANSVFVTVSSLCDYNYEVVVEDENTYRFECECALPLLAYTNGNITVDQDNQMIRVGGYGSSEREVNYGLDGDLVNTFTIYSRLTRGTEPVTVTWYYITPQGMRVLIEDSAVADYASVSENDPYNLVFSQVGDAIQGSYLVVAENAYGRDTQLTNIGILPKWDKTLSGMVTGTEASLGQTLVGRFGSELRITGTVREGTEPWSFGWYYNGVEIVEGGDYSFEYSGNQATIVIGNFEASDIGAYTAIVSNRYGQDTHTFNLMAETVVSCTDNITDTSTTCTECLFDEETKQSTLTVYAHSISQGQNLTWYQVNSETGEREQLSESVVVEGANSIIVSVSSLCNYSYEVVVENQNTYQFQCVCALPLLDYTSGNVSITEDNQMVQVGGYGSSEREVNYGLDGDLVNTFIINSRLTRGTEPVTVTWYYITPQGMRVLIEDSAVADYASVSENNPYNLVFSQVGDAIQGSYLVVAENAYGRDTQLTNIGILPKWDKTLSGMLTGTEASLGQTLFGRFGSELRITGTVREGTEPWSFRWYYNGVEIVEGGDYSFEYSGNQVTIVIDNFEASDIGAYMAIVSNRYGQDTHTFNFNATVVSCTDNQSDPSTTCASCQSNAQTRKSVLSVFAHSFPQNATISWFQINKNTMAEQLIIENPIKVGANSFERSVSDLCDYTFKAVVANQNNYTFDCPCTDCSANDGENTVTLSCCGGNQTLLRASDCGDDFFADVLLLIDVSASMDVEHAFLRDFLPRFEESLKENCVGNSLINRNQYTAVAFGSLQENNKELPYFVGPDLNRGDSTQNVFFTIDVDNPINVTRTIDQLPTIGEREDGFAATKFAVEYAQLRDNSIKFAILVTDEARQIFYSTLEEAIDISIIDPNDFTDLGRSLYSQLLIDNNIIPVQIIDITINATINASSIQCLGVSSAETCFYRDPNSNVIRNLEFAEVVNTADSQLLENVHKDYLQPALNARGYAWDLKVIRENETGNWDAITTALTNEVLLRAREELTQCRDCRCLPGGVQCQIVPLDQQAICKCEKSFPNNQPYCTCITGNVERPDFCRCRHISGFSDATCRETGMITLVRT